MIVADRLTASAARIMLSSASFALGPGVHALLGAPEDGVILALAVIAGRVRARRGSVRVLEQAPTGAIARRAIAYIPRLVALPDALRVREALEVAASIREEAARDPVERLAELGIESLAPRAVRSLSHEEARAVMLAEALTSKTVRVVLVEEPFVALDPRAAARLAERVRACARDGACIVVATASPRDAASLADDALTFRRGTLVHQGPALDPMTAPGPNGVRIRVLASDARALLAQIASEPAIAGVETQGKAIIARGRGLTELASAIGRAVFRARVEVYEMQPELPSLEELREGRAVVAAAAPPAPPAAAARPVPATAKAP